MDWRCGDDKKKTVLAWEKVCYPTSAGGLNIHDIVIWNKTAISKLLWNMSSKNKKIMG